MRSAVVYESIYGNTAEVARAVAEGLGAAGPIDIFAAHETPPTSFPGVELLVVGAPTHAGGLSTAVTRLMPISSERKIPGAEGAGIRSFIRHLEPAVTAAAVFDTKLPGPRRGSAAVTLANRLHRKGFRLVARPMSFLIGPKGRLVEGELTLARSWATDLIEATVEAHRV